MNPSVFFRSVNNMAITKGIEKNISTKEEVTFNIRKNGEIRYE